MMPRLFFSLALLFAAHATASVFGDGDPGNGVEDQRIHRQQTSSWPALFNSVGTVACNGEVEGSGVLLNLEGRPVVLTAGHVLNSYAIEDCEYHSSINRWNRGKLDRILEVGDGSQEDPLPYRYENDWTLAAVAPWPDWRNWALSQEQIVVNQSPGMAMAFLVGFDVVSGQVKAHLRCNFGSAWQTSLLRGTTGLVWDDCHSMGGASGGALFVQTPKGIGLLGIRIGSLFISESENSLPPEMGDRFDLQRHINVSLLVANIVKQ
jgi:hypothetical protein